MSDHKPALVSLLCGAICLGAAALPTAAGDYIIIDPLRGDDLATGIDHDFWELRVAPWGDGGAEPYFISQDGLTFDGNAAYLGFRWDEPPVAKWALAGDFRVSLFLETSPYPGEAGNNNTVAIFEVTADGGGGPCGSIVYTDGFGGLWAGSPAPLPDTYYPLGDGVAAHFLFVKTGNTLQIYKNAERVSEDAGDEVFFGNYFNPAGNFVFFLGSGIPNTGWIRARDVVIESQSLVACDGVTPIPDKWIPSSDQDADGIDDALDQCPDTLFDAIVDPDGCSVAQFAPCDGNWKNHGDYVSSVSKTIARFVTLGLIEQSERGALISSAARSNCGKKKATR
ncbi:hypothetical protein [uncultured Lamprocystis sp.]|jgi:hypothetical protein|uniref:hypothetical protein n=1 Tax=uncultured Lamprocystis sp. TaxID=543132 RepID=UPI0025EFFAA6|nr:hypothetical protein [uncultured Lamprocystis sp.]